MNTLNNYLTAIENTLATGRASEHAYRPLLKSLFESQLTDHFEVINEPKRIHCGCPDLVICKKVGNHLIDIGYIEAKDIRRNLEKEEHSEQLIRYEQGIENLILTNYLEFRFFLQGKKVQTVKIADYARGHITALPENFDQFTDLSDNFLHYKGQAITSSNQLAKIMAKKAKLIKYVLFKALIQKDDINSLRDQYDAFKKILMPDLNEEQFADVYAQTIAYGLFIARMHDKTNDDFSRQEARELVPKTNPFLQQLFDYISGPNLHPGVEWVVDSLCEVLRLVRKETLLKELRFELGQADPILHFYETFLANYDSKLRKARGVWYTPEPIVCLIVRAVDDCLKQYFNLPNGLASRETIEVKADADKATEVVHKVQLLDVATGTGTFLAEIIQHIHQAQFKNQQGMWSDYVEAHLLPRLHGFEILIAPYAMCYFRIEALLKQLGYQAKDPLNPQRLSVYLTNSLEQAQANTETLFTAWLSEEAVAANKIKRDRPIMVALGNPPYSVSSQNKGEWIQGLIRDYKKGLNEKKLNLDDDYIKFIRYAEHYIEKAGYGIVAMITNNSFLDGVTHRQMRKHLLETFDIIYIYNLHGNARRKEVSPDGIPDKNVFDIQQGVAISIFIKHKTNQDSKQFAEVYHYDIYGTREKKYQNLQEYSLKDVAFNKLEYKQTHYFFIPKDFRLKDKYERGFKISEIMQINNSGIKTDRDKLFINTQKKRLEAKFKKLLSNSYDIEFKEKFRIKNSSSYKLMTKIQHKEYSSQCIQKIQYRPFDYRFIYYDHKIVSRPAYLVMQHLINKPNLCLLTTRLLSIFSFNHTLVTKAISDIGVLSSRTSETSYAFPLYLYHSDTLTTPSPRSPNLNPDIIATFSQKLDLPFVEDHELPQADGKTAFIPLDLLDYIYAVLHSPTYREKYKEFLKIDFPRVPYSKNTKQFWQLVTLGGQLRVLHLLESPILTKLITSWNIEGNNLVEKVQYKQDRVYINKTQYFEGVPEVTWNLYIGGYQPAQKWLKDRKGSMLSYDDLEHYQKMITALVETNKLMQAIDKVYL